MVKNIFNPMKSVLILEAYKTIQKINLLKRMSNKALNRFSKKFDF